MGKRRKKIQIPPWLLVVGSVFILGFNVFLLVLGLSTDQFIILSKTGGIYSISNSNMMFVIAVVIINALTVYLFVASKLIVSYKANYVLSSISEKLSDLENNNLNNLNDGFNRVEAHLINYDKESIAFNHLSAIEHEIGLNQRKDGPNNEIWIITNDFEENDDNSAEAHELRSAILDNLAEKINYYYIILGEDENKITSLGAKLKKEKEGRELSGKFHYIINDSFSFMPTPYYDIIMYLKFDQNHNIEASSQIYYCFSRIKDSNHCYYQKVEENTIRDDLTKYVKDYKDKSARSRALKTLNL